MKNKIRDKPVKRYGEIASGVRFLALATLETINTLEVGEASIDPMISDFAVVDHEKSRATR